VNGEVGIQCSLRIPSSNFLRRPNLLSQSASWTADVRSEGLNVIEERYLQVAEGGVGYRLTAVACAIWIG
jgi:hypothetical protein